MEEEVKKEQPSLKDQAKELWAKIARMLGKGNNAEKEFTFGVSKEAYIIALLLFILSIGAFGMACYYSWLKNEELISRTWELKELNQYNLSDFSRTMSSEGVDMPTTIQEMVDLHNKSLQDKKRIEGEYNFKTSIYKEFLRNFLLPSLNIWKDPYTKQVDITMMGRKYLDRNPYQDISLLSQWSSIIGESGKEVGVNEVTDMTIGNIIEEEEAGYFKIPITVSFKSNSKRAFLLLVNKLSLTSNISNIGLLNDFTYYLFNVIREEKGEEIQAILEEYNEEDVTKMEKPEGTDDKYFENMIISRYLYNWVLGDDEEPCRLIDEAVIDSAVKKSIVCNNKSSEVCYFDFRDKYRDIPELAYTIGIESVVNKPLAFKRFLADLPPLIAIESFTFDKEKSDSLSLVTTTEYVGEVHFNIYGRGISEGETQEITRKLAEDCFGSGTTNDFELSSVLAPVQRAIEQIDELGQNSVGKMANLIELRDILNEDSNTYNSLTPYNKMIRKFEYYRMLKNIGGICN